MQFSSLSAVWAWTCLLGSMVSQSQAYPAASWPMYLQAPRDYSEDDYPSYYSAPQHPYYYDAPIKNTQDIYGRMPYPYHPDPLHYEDPASQDERIADLPIGRETWYNPDTGASWRSNDIDDVNAAFLDNLILTQMAQDAQRRREHNQNAQAVRASDFEEKDLEDEDVRELKALAGKPLSHSPKTASKFEDEDYPADDAFINWNGNKRSGMTTSTSRPMIKQKEGQDEVMVPRPASYHQHHDYTRQGNKLTSYDKLRQLLAAEDRNGHVKEGSFKSRKLDKRFVATDSDIVAELRGLKHRIPT